MFSVLGNDIIPGPLAAGLVGTGPVVSGGPLASVLVTTTPPAMVAEPLLAVPAEQVLDVAVALNCPA